MLNVHDLYASHLDRVYAFFAYRVSSPADAEDLTSATFERVVRHASRYDPSRAGVTTWIFAIAERLLIDHYRREGRKDERTLSAQGRDEPAAPDRPSIGVAPELQRALANLPDRERRVVGLRFGGDLSAREIAEVMRMSEANVHQVLSRSIRRMRRDIEAITN